MTLVTGCGGGGGGSSAVPQTRSVNMTLTASNLHGAIPATVRVGTGLPSTQYVDGGGVRLNIGSTDPLIVSAPSVYGDRAFVKWQASGQDVGTSATLSLAPVSLTDNGTVTAIYAARTPDADGFTPNYYKPTFPHWASFPVRVAFDTGTVASGSPTEAAIRVGMDRWVRASGGLISYTVVSDPTQADIQVAIGNPPSNAAGICETLWDGNNNLTHASITLRQQTRTDSQGRPLYLDTYAAHEFGHALGMTGPDVNDGHSPDSNDTMYAQANPLTAIITGRDMDTLVTIYASLFTGSSRGVHPNTSVGPAVHHTISY